MEIRNYGGKTVAETGFNLNLSYLAEQLNKLSNEPNYWKQRNDQKKKYCMCLSPWDIKLTCHERKVIKFI